MQNNIKKQQHRTYARGNIMTPINIDYNVEMSSLSIMLQAYDYTLI